MPLLVIQQENMLLHGDFFIFYFYLLIYLIQFFTFIKIIGFRRQLIKKYPDKVFIPCIAHQINPVFGDIFKENGTFKRVSDEAVHIISYFHKSMYFTGNLRDEQVRIYNKTISLLTPGDTTLPYQKSPPH